MKFVLWFLALLSLCLASQSGGANDKTDDSGRMVLSMWEINAVKMQSGLSVLQALVHGIGLVTILPVMCFFDHIHPYLMNSFYRLSLFLSVAEGCISYDLARLYIPARLVDNEDRNYLIASCLLAFLIKLLMIPDAVALREPMNLIPLIWTNVNMINYANTIWLRNKSLLQLKAE